MATWLANTTSQKALTDWNIAAFYGGADVRGAFENPSHKGFYTQLKDSDVNVPVIRTVRSIVEGAKTTHQWPMNIRTKKLQRSAGFYAGGKLSTFFYEIYSSGPSCETHALGLQEYSAAGISHSNKPPRYGVAFEDDENNLIELVTNSKYVDDENLWAHKKKDFAHLINRNADKMCDIALIYAPEKSFVQCDEKFFFFVYY